MTCSCGHIRLGLEVTQHLNWNPDCPEHGAKSTWWNSDEQVTNRLEQSARLRELQDAARYARRQIGEV